MAFDVVESLVRSKWGDPSRCEDVIAITDEFAAVIDGATTRRPGLMIAGLSPGLFAALCGKSAFEVLPPDSTASEAVARMSQCLATALAGANVSADLLPQAAFGFVAYSARRREIWRVADCGFACDGIVNAPRLEAERIPIEARSMLLQCLILSGAASDSLQADDPSARMIAPLIEAQAAVRNHPGTPWSFGAITGDPVPSEFVEVFGIAEDVREVVLASDGWPDLRPTLSESEAVLNRVLRDDPLMIKLFPATKGVAPGAISFDDRAYLRLSLKS